MFESMLAGQFGPLKLNRPSLYERPQKGARFKSLYKTNLPALSNEAADKAISQLVKQNGEPSLVVLENAIARYRRLKNVPIEAADEGRKPDESANKQRGTKVPREERLR